MIDGVWSTVGSTNLDWRSFLHNQEVNAVVLGTEFGDRCELLSRATSRSPNRSPSSNGSAVRSSLRVKEQFARLWQYWL